MAEAERLDDDEYEDDDDSEDSSAKREQALEALSMQLGEWRSEAIADRQACGIEDVWLEDEEFYHGVDDVNRGEKTSWRSKPAGQVDLGIEGDPKINQGSTVFFNLTRPFVDAGAARLGDMLIPSDDPNWAFNPSPVPNMLEFSKARLSSAEEAEIVEQLGEEAAADERTLTMAQAAVMAERIPNKYLRQIQQGHEQDEDAEYLIAKSIVDSVGSISELMDEATDRARAAGKRIEDWLVECQYHAAVRQVLEDGCRVGTGVLSGPLPRSRRVLVFDKGEGKLTIQETQVPATDHVSYWNCYPDLSGGENIHDGSYHFEKADITPRRLADLAFVDGYFGDQIDLCLVEGPQQAVGTWLSEDSSIVIGCEPRKDRKRTFQIWYAYAYVEREKAEDLGLTIPDVMSEYRYVCVRATMVNNRLIAAAVNHLDTGEFPYDYMILSQRKGIPWGTGIARDGRTAQRIVNAAARNMMDNAGLSGGPMWAYMQDVLIPANGTYELAPRKGWMIRSGATEEEIKNAFRFYEMPMRQAELQSIINVGTKLMEDSTGMPMLLQGQMGNAPDTVGGMTMLNNNATAVMRRVARLFDDKVTEPHIRRYYAYLLQWGEDPEEKGDFQIDARGSTALVERDANAQSLQQVGAYVVNPVFGLDPKKWMSEMLKAQKVDPKRLEFDDDQWREVVEKLTAAAESSGADATQVAEVRAKAMIEVQQLRNQAAEMDRELEKARLALAEEAQTAKAMLEQERSSRDDEMSKAMAALDQETAHLDRESVERQFIESMKVKLAEISMKLQAQFDMQREKGAAAELTTPPVEPVGRAPEGQAYQR